MGAGTIPGAKPRKVQRTGSCRKLEALPGVSRLKRDSPAGPLRFRSDQARRGLYTSQLCTRRLELVDRVLIDVVIGDMVSAGFPPGRLPRRFWTSKAPDKGCPIPRWSIP